MPSTDGPVAVGIAGLGRSGWNIHADAISRHPAFRVAAVADPVAERRDEARARFGCATYETPEEMVRDDSLELVTVATPSHTHAPLAVAALHAGRSVLVEKPMAQNLAEMDQMISAGARSGKVLTCFQLYRCHAVFVTIREIIDSGRIGRVISVRRASSGFARRHDWQMLRRYGGGELANNGPHYVDMALQLLGEGPVDVFADLQHTVGAGDAEDHVKLLLKNGTGMTAEIEISHCNTFPDPAWTVLGTAGGIQGDDRELRVKWFDPDALPPLTLEEGPAAGRRYDRPETIPWQEETIAVQQERPASLLFYDRLQATLREGAPVFVTPESVRRQIDIMERARQQTGLL